MSVILILVILALWFYCKNRRTEKALHDAQAKLVSTNEKLKLSEYGIPFKGESSPADRIKDLEQSCNQGFQLLNSAVSNLTSEVFDDFS